MRKILIEIETDSEESISTLKQDLQTEISCCWNSFDVGSMQVYEINSPSQECMKRGEQVREWIMQGMKEGEKE